MMHDEPAYRLDIEGVGEPSPDASSARPAPESGPARPWVGIHFDCCGVYTRVYRDRDQSFYSGCCPRCGRKVRLTVGADGTSARFFTAK